jgi:hypothetical protein
MPLIPAITNKIMYSQSPMLSINFDYFCSPNVKLIIDMKKEKAEQKIRVTSQPPLFDLTKTLTMKKFTFFDYKNKIKLLPTQHFHRFFSSNFYFLDVINVKWIYLIKSWGI